MGRVHHYVSDPRWANNDVPAHPREPARNDCAIACAVVVPGFGEQPAVLRDYTRRGFQVECGRPLLVGSDIQLKLPGCDPVDAVVRWSVGRAAGCAFHRPVREELLAAVIEAAPRVA